VIPSIAVICAALLWSVDGLLRQDLHNIPSLIIVALEHLIGALIFLPIMLRSAPKIKLLDQKGYISIFWVSICGGLLGTYFYTKALGYVNYIDLSVVVLIQKLQPIFAISLASFILKEKLSKRFILLAFTAIAGGYLVTFGNKPFLSLDDKSVIASLFAFLASFCWGSSTVLGKNALKQIPFELVTSIRLLVTGIIALLIIASSGTFSDFYNISMENYKTIIIIVFTSGSIALLIYYYGLQSLKASHTTIYELVWPLSAVLLDWLLKAKTLSLFQMIGGLILISSVAILTKEHSNE
tara:strand:- start:315 stop:1202 length:888 start_codon:yes stop_codon:yes gene_type:complete